MQVASEALPDMTALDVQDDHYDGKSTLEKPIWITRTMEFVEKFPRILTLTEIKNTPELAGMEIVRKGSRLSVTRVSGEHFAYIQNLYKGTKGKIQKIK